VILRKRMVTNVVWNYLQSRDFTGRIIVDVLFPRQSGKKG
jgi:hypothetical protein